MAFQLIRPILEINNYSGDMKPTIIGDYECDTQGDLPAQSQSTYYIGIGSRSHVIEDNSEWCMRSNGNWVMQESGTASYTKAEVDALLSTKITLQESIAGNYGLGALIPDTVTNLDGYLTDGVYYSGSAITPALDAFRLEVKTISESVNGAIQQTIYPLNPNGYYFTRVYYSNTWQPWRRVTPFGVVGTNIPDNTDITTLPIGRYYKTSGMTTLTGLPTGYTSAFYLDISNTVGSNRRTMALYGATQSTFADFYMRLETSGGYGSWYKFAGVQV